MKMIKTMVYLIGVVVLVRLECMHLTVAVAMLWPALFFSMSILGDGGCRRHPSRRQA